ncbi:MAG TPA: Rrf2 family transcriptional regulator [Bacteroidales bacterium]|nr:Rrf2 family transcriptional regulator [Bacteroidales bacterium]HRZ77177.1 Rrf2 family transcriptional regulator [Bacteroidales bacterium]
MGRVINLSEAGSIAIHSMVLIGKSEGMINVHSIAEQTGTSRHHVAKVLQRLVKEGFLRSLRGPQGGFRLNKDPEKITLLEIYQVIEGPLEVVPCPMERHICPFDKCIMSNVAARMTVDFKNYLGGHSLADFMK